MLAAKYTDVFATKITLIEQQTLYESPYYGLYNSNHFVIERSRFWRPTDMIYNTTPGDQVNFLSIPEVTLTRKKLTIVTAICG